MLSFKVLAALVLLLGALALTAPLHLLLLTRYLTVPFQGHWSFAGVRVDPVDIVLGFLLLAFFLRGREQPDAERKRRPYMLLWIGLGVLLSLSYLSAPINQENLTAAHRIGYQLYRYCWKGILFFPLALLLLDNRAKIERALFVIVLAADLLALDATFQGYAGYKGIGPFTTGNELAGTLVAPLFLSTIGFLQPKIRFRWFWIASSILILRGLLFTGSRGAMVALVAGASFCVAWLMTRPEGRARVVRLMPVVIVLGAFLLMLVPSLLERPTIRRALSARKGLGAATIQWRIQERWPHFISIIEQNPWLGIGTAVDRELAKTSGAPTPHNGYLAIAVANGIPVAALYVLFALLTLRNGVRIFARAEDPTEAIVGLLLAGGLVAILAHNMVEASLRLDFTRDLFWLICAICAQGALVLYPAKQGVRRAPPAGRLAHSVSR